MHSVLSKKRETTFSILCILCHLADVLSFEEILTHHISEDCRQLCSWKRAKQPSSGSAISKEEISSSLSFFLQVVYETARDGTTPGPPPKKIHCLLLNLGLSNELLHVRNLQLTIFCFRRWCFKQPGTAQPQDLKKKIIRERLFLGHGRNSSSREKKRPTMLQDMGATARFCGRLVGGRFSLLRKRVLLNVSP